MEEIGLDITIRSLVDCEVVALHGELDCQSAPELADALSQAATNGRPVVVDLSELRFIDSSGLHVLMSGGSANGGGHRILVCPPGNVARVELIGSSVARGLDGYRRDELDLVTVRYTPRLADRVDDPGAEASIGPAAWTGYIAFDHSNPLTRPNYDLWWMNVDTGNKVRLTFAPGADVLPVISPDGRRLMWTSTRDGRQPAQLYMADFVPPQD